MKIAKLLVVLAVALACADVVWARAEKSMVGQKLPALNPQYLNRHFPYGLRPAFFARQLVLLTAFYPL